MVSSPSCLSACLARQRIGEALAVRRCDVDLDAGQPLVSITSTIVFVCVQGFLRQPHPKHSKHWRTVTVPSFTAEALRERLAVTGEIDPEQTIFHTKAGTPLSPANVRRLWRSSPLGLSWKSLVTLVWR